MALKSFRPLTPSLRFTQLNRPEEISTKRPERSLVESKSKTGGRNVYGRITSRRRGGGHKQNYRIIDFKRSKLDIKAKVQAIEYDPNRTALLALLAYTDGTKSYILAPQGLKVGINVQSGDGAEIAVGNSLPLSAIPTGTVIHAVELQPGKGAQLGRSAGASIQLAAKDGPNATLRLPSGEMRMVLATCRATIGVVGNADHQNITIGKAGRARHMGKRPQTRGVAMNPVDHPHGGGEAHKTPGGHPTTPWGKPALGYRTRKKNKKSDDMIVRGRKRGKGRRR